MDTVQHTHGCVGCGYYNPMAIMNDQTAKVIEQLATRLGTTSEYLWTILLKQAPVSATIDLVYIVFIGIMWTQLYRAHKYFMNSDNEFSYDSGDTLKESTVIVISLAALVILLLATVVAFFALGDIFNGFFNPEFWALQYILNRV